MMCVSGIALSVYWTIEWVPTQAEGQGVGERLGDFLEGVKAEWNPLFFSPFLMYLFLFID